MKLHGLVADSEAGCNRLVGKTLRQETKHVKLADKIANAVAKKFVAMKPRPWDDPDCEIAGFAKPEVAEAINSMIEKYTQLKKATAEFFMTHPPLEKRLARLAEIARETGRPVNL